MTAICKTSNVQATKIYLSDEKKEQ